MAERKTTLELTVRDGRSGRTWTLAHDGAVVWGIVEAERGYSGATVGARAAATAAARVASWIERVDEGDDA